MTRAISNWSYWDNSVQVNLEQEQEVSKEVQEQEVVEQKEAPEYTTIVYQDKVGVGQIYFSYIFWNKQWQLPISHQAEQFYTETIVTDVMGAEEYYGNHGNGNHLGQQVGAEVEKPAVRIKVSLLISVWECFLWQPSRTSGQWQRCQARTSGELSMQWRNCERGAPRLMTSCAGGKVVGIRKRSKSGVVLKGNFLMIYLFCFPRLCDPARPFTAYSTLLTHYRWVPRSMTWAFDWFSPHLKQYKGLPTSGAMLACDHLNVPSVVQHSLASTVSTITWWHTQTKPGFHKMKKKGKTSQKTD